MSAPVRLPGRAALTSGVEVTVKGLGRCRFAAAVLGPDGEVAWVNVHDARNGGCHSVTPDRISTVHRKARLR